MKKRFLIIVPAVFFCLYLAITLTGKAALAQLETCVIGYDKLISEYTLSCTVRGERHAVFFDGSITELERQEGEKLRKDDVILKYLDSRGKTVSLKADYDGWLLSVSGSQVVIEDGDLKLYAWVPREKYRLMKIGQQGSFSLSGRICLAEIIARNDVTVEDGRRRDCQVVLQTDGSTELMSGQKVNVLMPLEQVYGLCVDSRALLSDENGWFLLDSKAAGDLNNWKQYRLSVEVIAQSQGKALISGVQLEGREVLILPEQYWKVLNDD